VLRVLLISSFTIPNVKYIYGMTLTFSGLSEIRHNVLVDDA